MDNTVHTEARSYRGTSSDAAGKTPSATAVDTGVDTEAKPTLAEDDFPLEKLKLMLVMTSDDDRRSPGLLGSGSAVVSVSPASVISGMDDGPFPFPEGDASLSKSRGSPVQRLLRLTGARGGSLRFFFNDLIDEGSGGVGGCAQGVSPRSPI